MMNAALIKTFKFLALLIFIFLGCWLLGRFIDFDIETYKSIILSFPLWVSAFIFILLYVSITTVVWLGPKDILRLLAAIVYGPFLSTLLVWAAELINVCLFFNLSRYLGRDFVVQKFKISEKDISRAQSNASVAGIVALRSNPLVPLRFLDIGYGLTGVSFKKYFLVAAVVTFPRLFWLLSILAAVGDAIFKDYNYVLAYFLEHPFILFYSGIYFIIVIALSFWAVIIKLRKKA